MKRVAFIELCGNLAYENHAVALLESFTQGDADDFSGLILWVNSGGGSFCCAQDIYSSLQRLSLPRIAVAGELCASAAYYVALSAHRILAQPASLVGGMCASLEAGNYARLHERLGITRRIYSRGPLKQMLSPYSTQPDGEASAINDLLEDMDEQFQVTLRERRPHLQPGSPHADGRLFSGSRAKKLGLVDALGGVFEAGQLMAKMLDTEAGELELVSLLPDELETPPQQERADVLSGLLAALRL